MIVGEEIAVMVTLCRRDPSLSPDTGSHGFLAQFQEGDSSSV